MKGYAHPIPTKVGVTEILTVTPALAGKRSKDYKTNFIDTD
jgi:hypothetical protein